MKHLNESKQPRPRQHYLLIIIISFNYFLQFTTLLLSSLFELLSYLPAYRISACRNTSFQAPLLLACLRQLVTPIDLLLSTDTKSSSSPTSADPRIKYRSRISIRRHSRPAQPLNINTLHNLYIVEELIQLTITLD